MRVYPKPLVIGDEEGFTEEKDIFRKAYLAKGMSHLVASVEDPLVIAFDGQWGSGKTTFLKMWAGELRKSGHPVIFFDAFENDYVEDAFAALARELVELAEEKKPRKTKVIAGIRDKASQLGTLLLKGATKVGTKVAVRAVTAGLVKESDFKNLGEEINAEVEDAAEAYMEQLLDKPRKQKQVAESFRNALSELPGLLVPAAAGEQPKPLVFIIDELDRCKPHFALALLERIKHFMSVPNVHFVLGVHLDQLQSSVKFAYGENINSTTYLQKFINLTILNVEKIERETDTDLHRYAKYLKNSLQISDGQEGSLSTSVETIIRLIRHEQMSYRTLERAFTVLSLAIGLTPKNRLQMGAIMGGLVMMKLLRPDLYKKAKQGLLNFDEAEKFLRFETDGSASRSMIRERNWWAYFLLKEIPKELIDLGNSLSFRFDIDDRPGVVKYTANEVIDRISPA